MRLTVEHRTLFEYDSPVCESATEVRLHPADRHGGAQRCLQFKLAVHPEAQIFGYTDYFGNSVQHFTVLPNHSSLQIVATSLVDTGAAVLPMEDGAEFKLLDFRGESRYVRFDPAVQQFAEQFRGISSPFDLGEAVGRRINEELVYEQGVTGVHSTSTEVIALGRGVCQDFAQLMIATCRFLGVPCRYVSGYFYGGEQSEGQNQASHAWCEVYGGPEQGWHGFDPTHSTLLADERYIRIGVGRDYADVPPVRGVYKGNAREKLTVAVRIAAVKAGRLERGLVP